MLLSLVGDGHLNHDGEKKKKKGLLAPKMILFFLFVLN